MTFFEQGYRDILCKLGFVTKWAYDAADEVANLPPPTASELEEVRNPRPMGMENMQNSGPMAREHSRLMGLENPSLSIPTSASSFPEPASPSEMEEIRRNRAFAASVNARNAQTAKNWQNWNASKATSSPYFKGLQTIQPR